MRGRCTNPRENGYANYGGRGITVCKRWQKFELFLADMGERPKGCTLDRKDVNGSYSKRNCRWATRVEQANNTRAVLRIEFRGSLWTGRQLMAHSEVPYSTLLYRLRAGWPVTHALKKAA
jgi:hypothetical protein